MLHSKIKIGLAFLIAAVSVAAYGENDNERLTQALKAGAKTESQKVVASALSAFAEGRKTCEFALTGSIIKDTTGALNEAPSWLIEAANLAFLKNSALDSASLAAIKNHHFLSDVQIIRTGDLTGNGKDQLDRMIRLALLDASPISTNLGKRIAIDIRDISVNSSDNTVSFKLQVVLDNGQTLKLQFRQAAIGVQQRDAVVARIVVAAIYSRELLVSDDRLRQEMNALAFDLKKLLRVSAPGVQLKVTSLIESLESAQPRRGLFNSLFSGSGLFRGLDTVIGNSFLTYLNAKDEVIQIAQQTKASELQNSRNGRVKSNVAFVERPLQTMNRGRLATGYVAPRRNIEQSHQGSAFATFLWIYDPFYMFSHPWYWGASNGSFINYWMMFDWMSEQQRRTDEIAQSMFHRDHPYTQQEMNRFDQPVTPVYNQDPAHPFIEPWNASQANIHERIIPVTDANGGTHWRDLRGQEIDPYEVTSANVQQRWSQATGEPAAAQGAGVTETILGAAAASGFANGTDGSGWGNPQSSERDHSIRGY